eukprot:3046005-Lingulodinium_polyedra.AAC.1
MAVEMHKATWFSVPGTADLAETTTGSRPGDPWADFVYNIVAQELAQQTSELLQAEGLAIALPGAASLAPEGLEHDQPCPFEEVLYVDNA